MRTWTRHPNQLDLELPGNKARVQKYADDYDTDDALVEAQEKARWANRRQQMAGLPKK